MTPTYAMTPQERVPLPLEALLPGPTPGSDPRTIRSCLPAEVLAKVRIDSRVLQDFRPITQSIEWELGQLHWARTGLLAFAENEVPFVINNTGRLSEDAATLLFNNCLDAEPIGPIQVLELGAGCGLFARYFLKAFQTLCAQENKPYFERLVYAVTDGSERTLAQWRERKMFDDYGERVVTGVCDAAAPEEMILPDGRRRPLQKLQAVFCNYLLDVLPATVVRNREGRTEELRVRTRLSDDAGLVRQYTRMGLEDIRALAASSDAAERARLVPLAHLFEHEVDYVPLDGNPPLFTSEALAFAGASGRVLLNHGAFRALRTLQDLLTPSGFVLINDYGATTVEGAAEGASPQRFGKTSAMGLNFPLLAHLFNSGGWSLAEPAGDSGRAIHVRLLIRSEQRRTVDAFLNRFAAASQEYFDGPVQDARSHLKSGRQEPALESYRGALSRNPRDWRLLGEVAEFVGLQLRDFNAGIDLARAALELNPWMSAWLWNVLGDCLYCRERHDDAHAAYLQAYRVDPHDARTHLNLSYTWQQFAEYDRALHAVAQGLLGDVAGTFTARLLEKQQNILSQMAARRASEQQRSAERNARLLAKP